MKKIVSLWGLSQISYLFLKAREGNLWIELIVFEALARIKEKIKNGEDVNKLELLYLPMYTSRSGKDMYDLLNEAIALTPKVSTVKAQREHIQSLMLLLMGRFVDNEKFREVMEANKMLLEDNIAVKVIEEMGMEKGMEKGIEKGIAQTVLEMLKHGLDIATISMYTKMPIEWIEEVKKEYEQK